MSNLDKSSAASAGSGTNAAPGAASRKQVGDRLHSSLHHPVARSWLETKIHPSHLMYPVFVRDVPEDRAIPGFAPNTQWGNKNGYESLILRLNELYAKGLRSVMLFGVIAHKDAEGSQAEAPDGPVCTAIRAIRAGVPDLLVAADVCLCEYTDHGHCGLLSSAGFPHNDSSECPLIDNDATLPRLAAAAVAYATHGAHMVCPSDMMDGRVSEIHQALADNGLKHVQIMAYTSKKASTFYAPFRTAVDSTFKGNRTRYQHPVGSSAVAARALQRDLSGGGADIVLVKPALFYGDIIAQYAAESDRLVAAYIVSGEAVMLQAYGERIGDLQAVLKEAHLSVARAGATILITYFTPELLDMIPNW